MLVQRMRTSSEIGVFDLDNTLTGPKEAQVKAHAIINARGPMIINTARETGMVMSSGAYNASLKYGYDRAAPHLGIDQETGKCIYERPERLDRYAGHLDPAAIIGFGGSVLLRQQDRGFAMDGSHADQLEHDFRPRMMRHLRAIDFNGDLMGYLSALEDETAFRDGRTDVEPLYWRIQVNPRDEAHKTDLKFRIASHLLDIGEYATVRIVEESRPGKPCFYIVPEMGTKEASADHLLRRALTEARADLKDVTLTLADDAFTGLRMLTDVLPGARATFILPGNAPVAQHLIPSSELYGKPFVGEEVSWLLERLTPTERPGIYTSFMPGEMPQRRFIIADQVVPNLVAADSICALDALGHLYLD